MTTNAMTIIPISVRMEVTIAFSTEYYCVDIMLRNIYANMRMVPSAEMKS